MRIMVTSIEEMCLVLKNVSGKVTALEVGKTSTGEPAVVITFDGKES